MGTYLSQLFKTLISNHKEFYMNALETLSHESTHMWWKCFESCEMTHRLTMLQLLLLSLLLPGSSFFQFHVENRVKFWPLSLKTECSFTWFLDFYYLSILKGHQLAGFFVLKCSLSKYLLNTSMCQALLDARHGRSVSQAHVTPTFRLSAD